MRRRSQRLRNRNELSERAKRISPSGEVRTKQTTIKKKRLTRKTLQKIRLSERSTFQIPNEIVLHAFTYLVGDQDFVENAPCVCREWYNYVDQKSLWIGALNRRGLSLSILDKKNDETILVFDLGGGVQGIWKNSYSLHGTGVPIISVQGDKGNVSLDWGEVVLNRVGAKPKKFKGKENNYLTEFKHFHDVVIKGKPLAFKPRQALADLEFMQRLLKGR